MKRTVVIIFIYAIMMFTACTGKASTSKPSFDDETILTVATEEYMESTTVDKTEIEVSDEEYLINLGKQLKLGMTEEEVIEKIGEPDGHMGSGLYWLEYRRGECGLNVHITVPENKVYRVNVYNKETETGIVILE